MKQMKISNDKTKRVALSNTRRAHLKRVTARTTRFGPCFRESALHNTNHRKGDSRQNRPNLSRSPVTVSCQARRSMRVSRHVRICRCLWSRWWSSKTRNIWLSTVWLGFDLRRREAAAIPWVLARHWALRWPGFDDRVACIPPDRV
jgi:hypothetical protein